MIRRIITSILHLALRIYFRRIEIAGLHNVPPDEPVIFVLNHPNALIDPVFLLCLAPRRVSFVAKAPLFRMPVIGYFVRALDSLPAYRRQDEHEDVSRNLETFAAARRLLASGGTIGICPEGVSHDEPRLKPLKSGTARIALAAVSAGVKNLRIVPTGLYYTEKTVFRSSALLYFGVPLEAQAAGADENGNPPREAVRALTQEIEEALRDVLLHAEHEEALVLIRRAEKILSAEEVDEGREEHSLTRSFELRQRLLEGYAFLRTHSPGRIASIIARIDRFENELNDAGIDPMDLSLPASRVKTIISLILRVSMFVIVTPIALVGAAVHYPAYRLSGYVASRFSHEEQDVISTFKMISAMLFFPLTWLVLAFITFRLFNWPATVVVLVIAPLCGYLAVRLFEEIDRFTGSLSALALFVTQRRAFVRLLAERAAIRREIVGLSEELPSS